MLNIQVSTGAPRKIMTIGNHYSLREHGHLIANSNHIKNKISNSFYDKQINMKYIIHFLL